MMLQNVGNVLPLFYKSSISKHFVSGIYTINDDELFKILAWLTDSEKMKVEPSAASGLMRPIELARQKAYINSNGLSINMDQATHIAWTTGGALVLEEDMNAFYQRGKKMLAD